MRAMVIVVALLVSGCVEYGRLEVAPNPCPDARQTPTVTGFVQDRDLRRLERVAVGLALNLYGDAEWVVFTNETGDFLFCGRVSDRYVLQFEKDGFERKQVQGTRGDDVAYHRVTLQAARE